MIDFSLKRILLCLKTVFYYKIRFKSINWTASLIAPLQINGANHMTIGAGASVGYKSWITANPLANEPNCELIISEGCTIGNFNHIYATGILVFEKNVLTAERVYVSDNLHGYSDINISIKDNPIRQNGHVVIGEGSWLGENVCVIGASIGKHCVIGANAVVTHDIPDYSVAVGNPAKIIKKYDFNTAKWIKL